MADKKLIIKYIERFHKYLCDNFDYGLVCGDKVMKGNNVNYAKYYRSLSPSKFEKYKVGICWDYAAYESYYFKKNFPSIKFKLYYIEMVDKYESTHTWLTYQYKGKYYLFEVSWYNLRGIHEFNTEQEMLNFYIREMKKYSKLKFGKEPDKFILMEYEQWNTYNLTCMEYMEKMLSGEYSKVIIDEGFNQFYNEACVAGVAAPAQLQGTTLRNSKYGSYSELEDYFEHPDEETDNYFFDEDY